MSSTNCQYCHVDTAGNHELGCPNNPTVTISAEFIPAHSCPDCARLKRLLVDMWELWQNDNSKTVFEHLEKLKKLEARLKREGIE